MVTSECLEEKKQNARRKIHLSEMEIKIRVHTNTSESISTTTTTTTSTVNLFDSTQKHSVAIVNRGVSATWKAKQSRPLPVPFTLTVSGQHTILRHNSFSHDGLMNRRAAVRDTKDHAMNATRKKIIPATNGGKNQIAIKKYNKIIFSGILASIAISGRQNPEVYTVRLGVVATASNSFNFSFLQWIRWSLTTTHIGYVAPHETTVVRNMAGNMPASQ